VGPGCPKFINREQAKTGSQNASSSTDTVLAIGERRGTDHISGRFAEKRVASNVRVLSLVARRVMCLVLLLAVGVVRAGVQIRRQELRVLEEFQ
jgi:hypothetical protein